MNVDLMSNGKGIGEVAQRLLGGRLNPDKMRPWIGDDGETYITVHTGGDRTDPKNYKKVLSLNAGTLRRDEWKQLDDTVRMISESRLPGFNSIISKGLTYDLGNGMANTVLEWHDMGDALVAELSMDALSRAKNDQLEFQTNYLPLPIVHVDYEINERYLMTSRLMGNGIDTSMAGRATRAVTLKLEQMLFTDTDYAWGTTDDRSRNKIYSFLNHPDRIPYTLSNTWDNASTSPKEILNDVIDMKQELIDNYQFSGPISIFMPTGYEKVLDMDYEDTGNTATGRTIRERILQLSDVTEILVVDTLPADNIVMCRMIPDNIRIVRGLPITNVQWEQEGGFINKFKVYTLQVPQIRSDQNGKVGLVHAAPSS